MLGPFMMVAAGLFLLAIGGDVLVRGALSLARQLNISPLLTGVLVVGFGTSAPELLVSVDAALRGHPDIAVGNVVGSNMANILLILGMSALIAPLSCMAKDIKRDVFAALLASFVLFGFAVYGVIQPLGGVLLIAVMLAYIFYTYRDEIDHQPSSIDRDRDNSVADISSGPSLTDSASGGKAIGLAVLTVIMSAAGLAIGAELLVAGATDIARTMGVSDAVIGLSLVAIGTSLPELAAAITAAARRETDVIIGNVLGSTLFNIFIILGITSLVAPLPIAPRLVMVDIPVSITAILFAGLMMWASTHLTKRHGLVLLALYIAYLSWLLV